MSDPPSSIGRSRHLVRLRSTGRHLAKAGRAAAPHLTRLLRAMRPYLLWILFAARWGSVIAGIGACLAFGELAWVAYHARNEWMPSMEAQERLGRAVRLTVNSMAIGCVLGITVLAIDRRVRSLGMPGLLLSLLPIPALFFVVLLRSMGLTQ